jgi:hypothetical protein
MTFLNGGGDPAAHPAGTPTVVSALPDEAFVVQAGSHTTIDNFSVFGVNYVDTLDLTPVLAGVNPADLGANIGNYVTVLPSTGPIGGIYDTSVTVNSTPGGTGAGNLSASVDLHTSTSLTTPSQVYALLTLPPN